MGTISHPLAKGAWVRIDLYSRYLCRVAQNLEGGRYLETMALAGTCLDVLVHHILDGLHKYHFADLGRQQIETITTLRKRRPTAGQIIDCLTRDRTLEEEFLKRLKALNVDRNRVVHPFAQGALKPEAIVPGKGDTRAEAKRFYSKLSRVIELAGGVSIRKQLSAHRRYLAQRRRLYSRARASGNKPVRSASGT